VADTAAIKLLAAPDALLSLRLYGKQQAIDSEPT